MLCNWDQTRHISGTQILDDFVTSERKHKANGSGAADPRISGYWLNMALERTQTIAEDENET